MRNLMFASLLLSISLAAPSAEFHVAPDGDDANPGSSAAPFASLERARDAVRELRAGAGLPEGGVTVWIHGGDYALRAPFALDERDGGDPDRRIVYRAATGESPRLIGGVRLSADAFTGLLADDPLERIPEESRGDMLRCDLSALGRETLGDFPDAYQEPPLIPELFFDGERMTLARWPNDDWTAIARVIDSGPAPWRNHEAEGTGTFEYAGDRPERWLSAPGVWLHGYWCFDWRAETLKVKSIDPETKQITFLVRHGYGIGGGNPAPRRYHAVNLLEELDAPGEYYIDRERTLLYFLPPGPLDGAEVLLSTVTEPIVTMTEVSHVTLRGITVEAGAGHGIRARGGAGLLIAACTVRNVGHDGIVVEEGASHRVDSCDIHDAGRAGLRIGGGDRRTLTPCGHEAVNNHIHHVSRRQRTAAYNVHIHGVGVRLAHNLLHDAPHQSIGLAGNDHVIELNEIHHTGMETDDCGSFYMGRNPSERGSVLRHNFWYHIGSEFTHGSAAVYFDDGSGGQTVHGNVFYRAAGGTFGAVFVHGGHDNTVDNSIFVECRLAVRQAPWTDANWNAQIAGELWQRVLLEDVDITRPPYSERYPELAGYMEPWSRMRLNHAYRNVVYNCEAFVQGNWVLYDNFVTNSDPGFVNAAALDFALKDDSPVFSRAPGFQAIPFGEIGLQVNELRPALPPEDRRAAHPR